MVMAWIWTVLISFSAISAILTGTAAAVSAAALAGASSGIQLAISLAGPLCLWSGLSHVMEQAGLTARLAKWMQPLLGRLFPGSSRDAKTMGAIAANVTANLFGLGNAATPLGIEAIGRMKQAGDGKTASDDMCRFIVMNTASIQLIPATVASVRLSCGCTTPFDILPAVWITSLCSVTAGLLAARILQHFFRL